MKKIILFAGFIMAIVCSANAKNITKTFLNTEANIISNIEKADNIKKVTLVASGLTCSMCSKAIFKSLSKLEFVDQVKVDIEKSKYILSFKPTSKVDLAQIKKAVTDAGFGVQSLVYE